MTNSQDQDNATTDSFDSHIVPAETRARKEREGSNYKQIPENSDGYTVDTEGLVNNYAIEPTMYEEDGGDLEQSSLSRMDKFTIVDVFSTNLAAENAVTEIHNAGISRDKISILARNYQDTEHGHGDLQWQGIDKDGGLAKYLCNLGIDQADASKYEMEVEVGKTVVIVIGKSEDVVKTQAILVGIGHRVSEHQTAI